MTKRVVRARAPLGTIDRTLLLCLADEDHAFGWGEVRPELGGDFILALPFVKADQRNGVVANELFNGRHKLAGDGFDHPRGSHGVTAVPADQPQYTLDDLQPGNVDVQIHPVDPFYL